ncbi:hypothetical protein [Fodinibius salsisoli]|uniref:Nucleoside 2-deoxyribosyltransferase n=1 Tax=Fodinibius salsisoli TaxID=2820877 RepID=A0ABT3PPZ8_9BACT|nr:hypothetical protein [Fodinibius salsisoli]MCW9707932.1 hypothetical protein [Fodinibius salsisoli]
MNTCPICSSDASTKEKDYGRLLLVNCIRCGRFVKENEWSFPKMNEKERALISYWIKHQETENEAGPYLESNMIDSILNNNELPTVSEKVDNLIKYLSDTISNPSSKFKVDSSGKILSNIGAINNEELIYLIEELKKEDLVNSNVPMKSAAGPTIRDNGWIQLTRLGWDYVETINSEDKNKTKSNFAFMAMEFGNPTLDKVFEDYLLPTVEECGYDLLRLDKYPKAGSIDDRIRREIEASKFILADVTNDNLGAYWEAGYAEGSNKTVIYLCEKDHFDNKETHFDINHHFTVVYDLDDLGSAMKRLKEVINHSIE